MNLHERVVRVPHVGARFYLRQGRWANPELGHGELRVQVEYSRLVGGPVVRKGRQ